MCGRTAVRFRGGWRGRPGRGGGARWMGRKGKEKKKKKRERGYGQKEVNHVNWLNMVNG